MEVSLVLIEPATDDARNASVDSDAVLDEHLHDLVLVLIELLLELSCDIFSALSSCFSLHRCLFLHKA